MQENLSKDIKFDEKGLVPAIAQDYKTGEILMFAWMNKESIDETIKTNFAHYFSRSRQKLWKKGETSGHTQIVKEILIDCDNDCLILKVEQNGGIACHTGARTCFFRNLLVIAVVCLTIFSGDSYAKGANKIDNLTVLSEHNMKYPLVKISRLYSIKRSAVVSLNFDYSPVLMQSINNGEPADVFISSHPEWIETLKQRGLVDVYNLVNIARDGLILVASKNNNKINIEEITKLNDVAVILQTLAKSNVPLVVDNENTSLGKYSRDILSQAKISDQKFYSRLPEDKKSLVDQINESEEYCGIVFASALKHYDNLVVLKEIEKSEIYYQALVIAGDNMGKGRDFLKFIKSDEARKILIDGGFVVE